MTNRINVFFLERYVYIYIYFFFSYIDVKQITTVFPVWVYSLYFTRKMPGCMHITINSRSTIGLNLSMGIWHKHTVQADTRHIGT